MKKRVCSFLLAVVLMIANLQGSAIAAEAPGDAVSEETADEKAADEEAAVEETVVEETSESEEPAEEAAAAETGTAAEESEPADDEAVTKEPEPDAAGMAAEEIVPQDPEEEDTEAPSDEMPQDEIVEEEAPLSETANEPAEMVTIREVALLLRLPEVGRLEADTDAKGSLSVFSSECFVRSAEWVTDVSGKTAFSGMFTEGETYYIKVRVDTVYDAQFMLRKADVTIDNGTLEILSTDNDQYRGHATMIVSFSPKPGNWLEELHLNVTGPEAEKTTEEVSAVSCVQITDDTDVVIEKARWVTRIDSYNEKEPWSGTFICGDTYYLEVKISDGGKDDIASSSWGNTFNTKLTVSGGTLERKGSSVLVGSSGVIKRSIVAVISVEAAPPEPGYVDVWIDNTEDKSVSIVSGEVFLTGAGGTQAGYNPSRTVYGPETLNATYVKPRTDEVDTAIRTATTTVYNLASQVKSKGSSGEYHMSTTELTEKTWDNRRHETTYRASGPGIRESIEVRQIGYTDTYKDENGTVYSVDEYRIKRIHTASGEYGKQTFYKVEANGWISGYKVIVAETGYGTAKADIEEGLEGTKVTLTATPDEGYRFCGWEVVSGDVDITGNTFTIGSRDVEVRAIFRKKPGISGKVTVYNVAQGIKVTWLKVPEATSYYIYRDDFDGDGYKFLFRTSALEVTDLEVRYELGKKFRYKVLATSKYAGDADGFRTSTYYRLMPTGITSVKNSGAGKMTVTYEKSEGGSGYVVRYGLKKDMSDAKVITVKGENTTSRTFSNLQKGKTYYVQVRTYKYEDGIRYYSGYCYTKTVKIEK